MGLDSAFSTATVVRLASLRGPLAPANPGLPLSPGEIDVWLLFVSPDDRRGSEARRRILALYVGVPPSRVRFDRGPNGKPRLSTDVGVSLCFNVSHSASLVVVAVSNEQTLGVDVELRRPRTRIPALAEAILAPAERGWWRRQSDSARLIGFYDLWSAKEAYAKLTGRGRSMPFREIGIAAPAAAASPVRTKEGGGAWVRRLALGPRFSGWLASGPPAGDDA